MNVWKIIRDITNEECPWLDENEVYKKGEIVFSFNGYTYGCVTSSGKPIRRDPTEDYFCEIPKSGLQLIGYFKEKNINE